MKVNNKGFAITTLIYGLAILVLLLIVIIMATLSSMRSNIKEMANQVENELLSQSTSSAEYVSETVGYNVFTTPINGNGYYRVEVWSPPNFDAAGNATGTYVTGVIKLDDNQKIYVYRGAISDASGSSKDGVYLTSVKPGENDQYYDGFFDAGFNKLKMILYVDDTEAKLIGGTNEGSRKLSYDYRIRYNSDGLSMLRYKFINTRIIKNIPYDTDLMGSRGKVTIHKLIPGANPNKIVTKNTRYWNLQGLYIDIKQADSYQNKDCTLYMTHDGITTCFLIGRDTPPHEDEVYGEYVDYCKDGPSDHPTFPFYTGVDEYGAYSGETFVEDLSLICKEANENLDMEIYVNGGSRKQNAISHNNYTRVYQGKYKHHNGEGIKVTQYQPDSIVDKIDNGNFYLLNYGTENYALTASTDGSSVGMAGMTGLNTQKWEISKVKNFNLTTNSFTNDEYNYFNAPPGGNVIDKAFKIVELSTFKALDIRYDENIDGNEISAQYTYNPLTYNEPQIWRLIPNQDGSYSIKTIIRSNNGDESVGYIAYDLPTGPKDEGRVYISTMKDGELKDNQKFTLFLYDYNTLEETN